MTTTKRCSCGRRISQYANRCSQCHKAHMADIHQAAASVVATGKCPVCGSPIRRNNAMTGWWQCGQYGADGRRMDNNKPACDWQAFTE